METTNTKNRKKPALQQGAVMPRLFSVSMLFKKKEISYSSIGNKITEADGLCGRVLRATTEQEAFGLAYGAVQDKYKNWHLASKVTFEIPESLINGE